MKNNTKIAKTLSFIKTLIINILHITVRILIGLLRICFIAAVKTDTSNNENHPTLHEKNNGEKLFVSEKYFIK